MPIPAPGSASSPMPPLPSFPSSGSQSPEQGGGGSMAQIMAGLTPVKNGVDAIISGAKQIVQSGAVAGSEQVCAQIIALATSLLPMAAQQVMGGQQNQGPIGPVGA